MLLDNKSESKWRKLREELFAKANGNLTNPGHATLARDIVLVCTNDTVFQVPEGSDVFFFQAKAGVGSGKIRGDGRLIGHCVIRDNIHQLTLRDTREGRICANIREARVHSGSPLYVAGVRT